MRNHLTPVTGPSAWRGPEIDYRAEGMHVLSAGDIAELDTALDHLLSLGPVDFAEIAPDRFPLPTLGPFFVGLGDTLRFGRGFLLLRGLPRERYSLDDLARIYFGIGCHIGRPLPQSYLGELLGHVVDVSDVDPRARAYRSGGPQRMHSDSCDIIGLMCVRAAKSGGLSRISSSAAVHNRLLETRPDLLEALYGRFVFRRMELDAELGSGELLREVSLFSRLGDELVSQISTSYPRRAVAAGDAAMTPLQVEAVEELARLAASSEFYLDMSIGEGDIQFLNNRTMIHGRTEYDDAPDIAHRRHMMRLWLEVASWPPLLPHQIAHTVADHPLWLRQRQPFMEVPSRYFAEMSRRQGELVR
jgi:hypothetical protein